MNWKETYTKVFLKQKGMAISDVTLKQYISQWWQNTRAKEQGGLRLTNAGFEFVRNELDLATYDVPFPKDFEMTTNTIIWLDQFITCPYYLFKNSIVVLDERKAMELHLFSGDIKKYGLTKAMNRHKK